MVSSEAPAASSSRKGRTGYVRSIPTFHRPTCGIS
jgi:hypothetical protein